ncbi:MAG: 2,3-bisphosphoglycerate-independent phosphoglycerate mutase [Proteiniphilum sp.]|nr:2,3-bisphosphoglycerate-independent phosphoglycerate mutase [Proteiniphilum sp.]
MRKKALLMILDGWGIGDKSASDLIYNTETPYWDSLIETYPHAQLLASGENVGLPDGQMGNSEVGHLNIGAGRVVYQDLVKINRACADNSILQNPEIIKAYTYAKDNNKKIHFLGLVSDGGVHSSLEHLKKLLDISKEYGVEQSYVHAFMDGRDTDPQSGKGFIEELEAHMAQSTGKIASLIGRYYSMDRDRRWERVKKSYDLLVKGTGTAATNMAEAVQASYDAGVTDEFILPVVNVDADGNPIATIEADDVVIFFNYRNDRAKELTIVLTQEDMPDYDMHTIPLQYFTMTPYDSTFKGMNVLFNKDNVANTMGEYVSDLGLTQLRVAETEKFPHVTFFFSGGREAEFKGESRILIPSPKVATYDLQPEMSAPGIAEAMVEAINSQKHDFIVLNFANCDMVGHTGVRSAIQEAIKAVDKYMGQVVDAAKANDYETIIIADHGNADFSMNADGSPNTAHSLNPVPIVYVTENKDAKVKDGILADVSPTMCQILGIDKPAEMTGEGLLTI